MMRYLLLKSLWTFKWRLGTWVWWWMKIGVGGGGITPIAILVMMKVSTCVPPYTDMVTGVS